MIEKELKAVICEEEFNKLSAFFKWETVFKQINYYYGSNKRKISDTTVRIRECNGYKLQVKIPKGIDGSLHIKEEFEESIDQVYSIIKKERLEELTNYPFYEDQMILGELTTIRRICRQYSNVEIALDENYYLGSKDYELEVEYMGEYPIKLVNTLKMLGIDFACSAKGKNRRFMEILTSKKEEQ